MTCSMSSFLRTVWFTRHGDVRVVWRLVLFLLWAGLVGGLLAVALDLAGFSVQALEGPAALAALLSATAFMTRRVNRKPFGAAGLARSRGAGRDFALGCFLGLLMMGGIFLVEYAVGFVHVESRGLGLLDAFRVVATSVFLFTVAALGEEILFRGYAFQTLMQGMTFLPAALGMSALFALAHLGNPDISVFGLINVGLAGMWLSLAYLKTRTLWLPFGLHFSWNFCQTTLFAFPTSGIQMGERALFSLSQGGPVWATGGTFGPEGGVLATIAILLCTGHILKSSLYRRQDGVITLDSIEDLIPPGERKEEPA